jgi:hypothetical protein
MKYTCITFSFKYRNGNQERTIQIQTTLQTQVTGRRQPNKNKHNTENYKDEKHGPHQTSGVTPREG